MQDYRFAVRSLIRRPGLSLAAILTLGLALGASATIFGLVDALWLRPPGVAAPGELVRIFGVTADSDEGAWSYQEVLNLQARSTTLSHVVARGQRGAVVPDASGTPALVLVNVISPNFFDAMGIRPAYGRLPGNERDPVVALGHGYWLTRFGGDPAVIGSTLPLGGGRVNATIIGVLPPSFRELEPAADRDLWLPPVTWERLNGVEEFTDPAARWFGVAGRRSAGRSVDDVSTEVAVLVAGLSPATATEPPRRSRVVSDLEYRLTNGGSNILALLSLVVVVSLITCVNLAELLLAGVAQRRREFATRVALGASRARLTRALVTEGALLGIGGLLTGLVIAMALMRLVPAVVVPPPGFRSFLVVGMDLRVFTFLAMSALACTVIFSLAPARLAARTDLLPMIKGGDGRSNRTVTRTRAPLGLVAQIALAFVLLSAATVLARSFLTAESTRFGITDTPVLTAWAVSDLPTAMRTMAEGRLAELPGVTDVALAIRAPLSLSGGGRADTVRLPGASSTFEVKYNAVSANYFSVVGTTIVDGRPFSRDDERARRRVAVISRTFAAAWPDGVPVIGSTFTFGVAGTPFEVVGVAADAAINEIGEPVEPYIYLPFETYAPGEVTFLLALREGAAAPMRETRTVLMDIDRSLEPRRLIMLRQYVDYATGDYRATATLAGALGVLGLVLTIVGVYGVTAYRTSKRTREFGIRSALGALRSQVLALVLRETFVVIALGLGLGCMVSLWTNRVLESLLLGIKPWDPWSLSLTALILATGLLLATIGPALRAASVNPIEALRDA